MRDRYYYERITKWRTKIIWSFFLIVFSFVFTLVITGNSVFFMICSGEYTSGHILSIDTLHPGVGIKGDIKYRFKIDGVTYYGHSKTSRFDLENLNFVAGDTVDCIRYCECCPESINDIDFDLYFFSKKRLKAY